MLCGRVCYFLSMKISDIFRSACAELAPLYGESESRAVVRRVFDERFGLSLSDVYMDKDTSFGETGQAEFCEIVRRLKTCEPVQYVLGSEEFCGHRFMVNRSVLIPRPETEDLVAICLQRLRAMEKGGGNGRRLRVLDVGTGSGCIAVSLKLAMPQLDVWGWDISGEALEVARENARLLGADVQFECVDMRSAPPLRPGQAGFDLIVSNPPYIRPLERETMHCNVLNFEPAAALFAPQDDALCFYRALHGLVSSHGRLTTEASHGGSTFLCVEINEALAAETRDLLETDISYGLHVTARASLCRDGFGRWRFVVAEYVLDGKQ